jgi:hypothetical protein
MTIKRTINSKNTTILGRKTCFIAIFKCHIDGNERRAGTLERTRIHSIHRIAAGALERDSASKKSTHSEDS